MDGSVGGRRYDVLFLVLGSAVSVFVLLVFLVPFLNPYGSLIGLDGAVGRMDHENMWTSLDVLSSSLYSMGDLMCHQEQYRTLMLNGNEMPLCVRDSFLFLGIAAGFVIAGVGRLPFGDDLKKLFAVSCIMVLFTLADWSLEHYTSFDSPALRAVVSVLSGAGASSALYCIYRAEERWLREKAKQRKV